MKDMFETVLDYIYKKMAASDISNRDFKGSLI